MALLTITQKHVRGYILKLRSIREGLRPEQRSLQATCDELLGYINDVSENVRRLSRGLSPNILEDLGLSAAIRWLVEKSCKHSNLESTLDIWSQKGAGTLIAFSVALDDGGSRL